MDKCMSCSQYNKETNKPKNKLRCMLGCEPFIQEQMAKAYAYNRAVSGEDFDTEEMYEHGNKVFGSGLKKGI